MSKIIAKYDLDQRSWDVTYENLADKEAVLFINFEDTSDSPINFNNLRFKYELRKGDEIIKYNTYPPANIRYDDLLNETLETENLSLEPNTEYQLFLWAENNYHSNADSTRFVFTTPKVQQPFSSWTWNDTNKTWMPPVEKPDDGQQYYWNETNYQSALSDSSDLSVAWQLTSPDS